MANTVNDIDLKAIYGFILTKPPVDFFKFEERKDSVSNDWPEENGIDIDLGNPKFKPRQFTINCAILADDRADFKNKYNGLRTLLKSMDTQDWYFETLDETYHVYYVSQSNLLLVSKFTVGEVAATFDLVLAETDPDDNFDPVFLVDDDGDFIIV